MFFESEASKNYYVSRLTPYEQLLRFTVDTLLLQEDTDIVTG